MRRIETTISETDKETLVRAAARQGRSLRAQYRWILAEWSKKYRIEVERPLDLEEHPERDAKATGKYGGLSCEKQSYKDWREKQFKITNAISLKQLLKIWKQQRKNLNMPIQGVQFSKIIKLALKERLNDTNKYLRPRWKLDDYRIAFRIALIKKGTVRRFVPDRFKAGKTYGSIWYAINTAKDMEKCLKEAEELKLAPRPEHLVVDRTQRPDNFIFELWQLCRKCRFEAGKDISHLTLTSIVKRKLTDRSRDIGKDKQWRWSKEDFRTLFQGLCLPDYEYLHLEDVIFQEESMGRWIKEFEERV